ncbi:MAG: ATP-dependent Clp protease proteolytic subunit [Bauldia sp.]
MGNLLRWAAGAGAFLAIGAAAFPADAAQFSRFGSGAEVMIVLAGPIEIGDAERLASVLATLAPNERVGVLALDSPGGVVRETAALVNLLPSPWIALVPSGATCASACTLIFGAASARAAAADAKIGVHSSSAARGAQTLSARVIADGEIVKLAVLMGLPGPIIDKMQRTPPDQIDWLTPADLRLWNVTVLPAR